MTLDNSAFTKFQFCPLAYYERYVQNLEPRGDNASLSFGTRLHAMLQRYYSETGDETPLEDEALEYEAQTMFAAYQQRWPRELDDFDIVDVERVFKVGIPQSGPRYDCGQVSLVPVNVTPPFTDEKEFPGCPVCDKPASGSWHSLTGKFDGIIRMKSDGRLWVFEHKTEKANGKRNLPEAWASRNQVSLYIWAAEKVYQEPFGGILLNVLTRQTPKGQKPCFFRRDHLVRTEEQRQQALHDFIYVADQIERLSRDDWRQWPGNRDNCFSYYPCAYRDLHLYGRDENQLVNFQQAKPYLDL